MEQVVKSVQAGSVKLEALLVASDITLGEKDTTIVTVPVVNLLIKLSLDVAKLALNRQQLCLNRILEFAHFVQPGMCLLGRLLEAHRFELLYGVGLNLGGHSLNA